MNATRLMPGATSLSSSSHLPVSEDFDVRESGRVSARTCQAFDEVFPDRVGYHREYDRDCARLLQERCRHRRASGQDHVRLERNNLFCKRLHPFRVASRPTKVDLQIVAFAPAQLLQGLLERREAGPSFRVVRSHVHNHAYTADLIALLGACRERPRRRRYSDKLDDFASLHFDPPRLTAIVPA